MFIGIARYEIFIPEARSLKDKRHVLRSITGTVQHKFKVAIAEVDHQDLWQRAAVGVSCVAESVSHCRKVLQEVEKAIGRAAIDGADIVDREQVIVSMEDL
jgi:uncharacterized protein YlxP (DUF503 family)